MFRELDAETEKQLKMTSASHGELDAAATASVYGLTDGDQVSFSGNRAAPVAMTSTSKASSSAQGSSSKAAAAPSAAEDDLEDVASPEFAKGVAAEGEAEADASSGRSLFSLDGVVKRTDMASKSACLDKRCDQCD